jgi:hypothetical protein
LSLFSRFEREVWNSAFILFFFSFVFWFYRTGWSVRVTVLVVFRRGRFGEANLGVHRWLSAIGRRDFM